MNPWLKAKLLAIALIVGKSIYDDTRGFLVARKEWRDAKAGAIIAGTAFNTPEPTFHWTLWLERIVLAVVVAAGAVFGLDQLEKAV